MTLLVTGGASTVEIGDLLLRVPGIDAMDRADARALGEEVARRLADALPGWRFSRLPAAIDLRVTLPPGTGRGQLAEVIAAQLLRALR